jgi:hypothetical protein
MPIIECAECKGTVSTNARACPHCGAPTQEFTLNTRIPTLAVDSGSFVFTPPRIAGAVLTGLSVLFVIFAFVHMGSQESRLRRVFTGNDPMLWFLFIIAALLLILGIVLLCRGKLFNFSFGIPNTAGWVVFGFLLLCLTPFCWIPFVATSLQKSKNEN